MAQEAGALRAHATAESLDRARAALARRKIELGDQEGVTTTERDALEREVRYEAETQQRAAQQAARDEATRAAHAQAEAAADRLQVAREAIGDSLHALAGGDARIAKSCLTAPARQPWRVLLPP